MAARSRILREEATSLISQLPDADAKDLFHRSILIPLDDVDSFVAGSPARMPGESQWEESWLSMGDYLLDVAQRGLAQLKERIQPNGTNLQPR